MDVEYVRRAVRTIGRCAIKLEVAAEKCIKVLLQLIATKVNYVVQEAVVVIKDIFRRYPNRYESIIGVLCSSLESLDEPEAKASMIWIIGEYADRIDNAGELLQTFLDSFADETTTVQLQLLTAAVKLFLRKPAESEELVQAVLGAATERSDNPDLRDRGYIYWRLLSSDPDAAKAVILAERPVIADDTGSLDPVLLDTLTRNLSTLASVYHKPPESFVRRQRVSYEDDNEVEDEDGEVVYGDDELSGAADGHGEDAPARSAPANGGGDDDLLGIGGGGASNAAAGGAGAAPGGGLDDLFGAAPAPARAAAAPAVPDLPVCGEKDGLVIHAGWARKNRQPVLELVVHNQSGSTPVSAAALKFNVNVLGLSPASPAVAFPVTSVGSKGYVAVPIAHAAQLVSATPPDANLIMAALRDNTSGRVVFFGVPLSPSFSALFSEEGMVDRGEFVTQWRTLGADREAAEVARDLPTADQAAVIAKLAKVNVFHIANRPGPDAATSLVYFSAKGPDASGNPNASVFLVEITFKAGFNAVKVVVKTAAEPVALGKMACAGIAAAVKAA